MDFKGEITGLMALSDEELMKALKQKTNNELNDLGTFSIQNKLGLVERVATVAAELRKQKEANSHA